VDYLNLVSRALARRSRLKLKNLRKARRAAGHKALVGVESLEDRRMMAGNPLGRIATGVTYTGSNPKLDPEAIAVQPSPFKVSAYLSGRTLVIEGTDASDDIVVRHVRNILKVDGVNIITSKGAVKTINSGLVDKIEVHGYKGGDMIDLSRVRRPTEVWAGEGIDTVIGGEVADILHGGAHDDTLFGNDGLDRLLGDEGIDTLGGGNDADELFGGADRDFLFGNFGADKLWGEGGDDDLWGGVDNDVLYGGEGIDSLLGEDDNDWLEAGAWFEAADGGEGVDWNAHVWAIDGAEMSDVDQEYTGTCSFLATLASASRFYDLASNISYEGDFTYAVTLYDDAAGGWFQERVRFDGTLREAVGSQFDPSPGTEGEFWTIVYQRAYLQHFEGWGESNWILSAWFPGETAVRPMKAVLGVEAQEYWTSTLLPEQLQSAAANGPVVADGEGHAYAVNEVYQDADGSWFVALYNPWGKDETHDPALVAEPEVLTFTGSDDGFIVVSWDVFAASLVRVVA
jgi:Ca2+-binding RTX toxin-like protein